MFNNSVKKNRLINIIFLIALLGTLILRCFFLFKEIDPKTGFYINPGIFTKISDISIILFAVYGIFASLFRPETADKIYLKFSRKQSLFLCIASLVIGGFFVQNFLAAVNPTVDIQFFPLELESEQAIFFKLKSAAPIFAYFALLSGCVMFFQAFLFLKQKLELLSSSLFKCMYLFPIVWVAVISMRVAGAYTSIIFISEHILEVFAIIFALRTFFLQAVILTFKPLKINTLKSGKTSAMFSMFFCLASSIPLYFFYFSNPNAFYFSNSFFYKKFVFLSLIFGIYSMIIAYCFNNQINSFAASSNKQHSSEQELGKIGV